MAYRQLRSVVCAPRLRLFGPYGHAQSRSLYLHEHEGMSILGERKIKVPAFRVVRNLEEIDGAVSALGPQAGGYVVKAQILGGGRGLGYFRENDFKKGVHMCTSSGEIGNVVAKMLGNHLVTVQTGGPGRVCESVMISEKVDISRLLYMGILINGAKGCYTMIGSRHGGTAIEETARADPDAIKTLDFDTATDWYGKDANALKSWCKFYELSDDQVDRFVTLAGQLSHLFREKDCTLLEVNPLVVTKAGELVPVDVKMNFDDNAESRHPDLFAKRDLAQEDAREVNAQKHSLNYIGLDGNIGCMVNGAGLAMATMDLLKLHGGTPANFLDIGGGANEHQVLEALRILNDDKQVTAILVNIFGGIMRCDIIAAGMIQALKTLKIQKPVIVRLQGTHQDIAKDQLNTFKSDHKCDNLFFEENFDNAARQTVAAA